MTAQQRRRTYADRENLLAALEWSWHEGDARAALQLVMIQSTTWMCAGDVQGRQWLERVLAEPEPAVHPARVRALLALAQTLHDSGAEGSASTTSSIRRRRLPIASTTPSSERRAR